MSPWLPWLSHIPIALRLRSFCSMQLTKVRQLEGRCLKSAAGIAKMERSSQHFLMMEILCKKEGLSDIAKQDEILG